MLFLTNVASQAYLLYLPSRTYMPFGILTVLAFGNVHAVFGILTVLDLGILAPLVIVWCGMVIVTFCKQKVI